MPGIVATFGRAGDAGARLDEMIEACHHRASWQVSRRTTKTGAVAGISLPTAMMSGLAQDTDAGVGLLLDGWIHDDSIDVPGNAAEHCLRQYLREGEGFVGRLNGEFNILIWDDRADTILLLNDRFGCRPVQFAVVDGSLYVAPEAKAIVAGTRRKPQIDEKTLSNYLIMGRVFLGQGTFFDGISVLGAASILRYRSGAISQERYWRLRHRTEVRVDDDFIQELVDRFRTAVRIRTLYGRTALALSGGLDSRAVAAACALERGREVKCFSWGIPDNDDSQLAEQVARRLGLAFEYIELGPDDWLRSVESGVHVTEGLDWAVQSYAWQVFKRMSRTVDIGLTGLLLDMPLGGSYLTKEVIDAPPNTDIKSLLADRDSFAVFTAEDVRGLIRPHWLDRLKTAARQLLDDAIDKIETSDLADANDEFFQNTRFRVIMMRQTWQRHFIEDLAPTLDRDLMDLMLQIPATERLGHKTYRRFLDRLCPELGDIPYHRTMLPPSAPTEFWTAGKQIEHEREKLYRDIWRETGGQVFIPYRHYYSNFDEWYRLNESWIERVDGLLLSKDTLVAQYLIPEAIRRLIDEHRSAKRSAHRHLNQLITLELLLRSFFSS